MPYMTPTIEKYVLKMCSISNQIEELEKIIEDRKGIGTYSSRDPERVVLDTVLKLQNARMALQEAMDKLLLPTEKKAQKNKRHS